MYESSPSERGISDVDLPREGQRKFPRKLYIIICILNQTTMATAGEQEDSEKKITNVRIISHGIFFKKGCNNSVCMFEQFNVR